MQSAEYREVLNRYTTPLSKSQRALPLLLGLALLTAAAVWAWRSYSFSRSAAEAQGTVVNVHARRDDDGTTWAPEVRFDAQDGRTYTFTSNVSSSSRPAIGSHKRVLYDPSDPDDAKILDVGYWIFQPMLALFGIVFLSIGAFGNRFRTMTQAGYRAYQQDVRNGVIPPPPGLAKHATPSMPPPVVGAFMPNARSLLGLAPPSPPNPEVVAYVKASRAAGIDDATIRQTLIGQGWDAAVIDASL